MRAALIITHIAPRDSDGPKHEEATADVSLAGAYFETEDGSRYTVHDTVMTSVAIPEHEARHFPFRRLSGRSRIVRITELPQQGPSGPRRHGIALEFSEDVTALTAIPPARS